MQEEQGSKAARGVLGIGTDIIECERIAGMEHKHGEEFLSRVFTAREIAYCGDRKMSELHYAGRWAAKEAVLKVLASSSSSRPRVLVLVVT